MRTDSEINLVDRLLAEQRSLTAVERFAQKHERADFHVQGRHYRDLIPLTRPAAGQQYAFEVNLDKCTGCKACVSACHSLNGLEEDETWRDVGTLFGHQGRDAYQQTVTTACHHCAEPGCLEGCPVMAYEKDEETGIVRHLDDQCIGCQYCTMKCPYNVPKYSDRLGIVRKCDMCHSRLAAGEAPACVQACPHEAIVIRLVDIAEVTEAARPGTRMLPGTFDSSYTKPTTRYVSKTAPPAGARPADAERLHAEHAHWPLIIMLVFTQMAVGLFLAQTILGAKALPLGVLGFLMLNAGLVAAVFHLGRPLGAWRFFLGLRTSWMSREILAFSLVPGVALASLAIGWFWPDNPLFRISSAVASLAGLAAIFTSVMIYVDTRRHFWRLSLTAPKFFGTALVTGAAAAVCLTPAAAPVAFAFAAALFLWEFRREERALEDEKHPDHLPTLTLYTLLPLIPRWRAALTTLALVLWVAILLVPSATFIFVAIALPAVLIGQILERFAFFSTVTVPRMPGGI